MNLEDRMALIKNNSVELLGEQELRLKLEGNKKVTAYVGRAPTGPLHAGHIIPLAKTFDFLKAGVDYKILIADLHAALDDLKTPWSEVSKRYEFTKKCIELSLPWQDTPEIVKGSSFQLTPEYTTDVLKLSSLTTVARASRAASEVTRMNEPKVSELIYPLMQSLDEQYLNTDLQWGGVDQRHIMVFAREYLPKLGYEARSELMTPLITSLKGPGVKMSSSIPDSIIKVYDSVDDIVKKINAAFCPKQVVGANPIIELTKYLVFPINKKLLIERPVKYGGDIEYVDYNSLETDFINAKLHPMDLKKSVSAYLVNLFSKVRNYFENNQSMLEDLGSQFMTR